MCKVAVDNGGVVQKNLCGTQNTMIVFYSVQTKNKITQLNLHVVLFRKFKNNCD